MCFLSIFMELRCFIVSARLSFLNFPKQKGSQKHLQIVTLMQLAPHVGDEGRKREVWKPLLSGLHMLLPQLHHAPDCWTVPSMPYVLLHTPLPLPARCVCAGCHIRAKKAGHPAGTVHAGCCSIEDHVFLSHSAANIHLPSNH